MKKKKIVSWLIILTLLLSLITPQRISAATADILGGQTTTGDLRITVSQGNIDVYRYDGSMFVRQYYAPADAVLDIGGTLYALGTYFKYVNGSLNQLYVTSQTADSQKITTTWVGSGFEITQIVTLPNVHAQYIKLQWSVKNTGSSTLNNMHFLRGEDTFLAGGDTGAGYWDEATHSIGVSKVVSGSTQRLFMQGLTVPNSYTSQSYDVMAEEVADGGTLSKVIDPNESTDNGYAMEWSKDTLASGTTWTINAIESFVSAAVIGSGDTVAVDAQAGEPVPLTYTVTNSSNTTQNVTYSCTVPEGWVVQTERDNDTLLPGQSTTLSVIVTPPVIVEPGTYDIILNISNGEVETQTIGSVTINGYNPVEVATGAAVTLTPLEPPTEGMATLSVATSGAIEAGAAVYYRVVSSKPEAMMVGAVIDTNEWNLVSDTDGETILVPDGYYVEVAVITTGDSKVVNWGVSEAAADGHDSTVVTGPAITVLPLDTPEPGKVVLAVSEGSIAEGSRIYYRVVNTEPIKLNDGDSIDVNDWVELTNPDGQIINAPDGSFIEVVAVDPNSNLVRSWAVSSEVTDGVDEPIPAAGLTVEVTENDSSNTGSYTLSISSDTVSNENKLYYRVVSNDPTALNAGDIIDQSEWIEVTDSNGQIINVPEGGYVEAVAVNQEDNSILLWGKSQKVMTTPPVLASGVSVTLSSNSTPKQGKVILSTNADSLSNGAKLYYKVVTAEPSALNVGDTIDTTAWIEVTNLSGQEISVADGSYVEVVAIDENNKVIHWGTSGKSDDGYTINNTNNGSSSSGSSGAAETVRQSEVKAENGTDSSKTANISIIRSTDQDKKVDSVTLDSSTTKDVLDKNTSSSNKKVTIVISDLEKDPADEVKVTVKKEALSQLAVADSMLEIQTEYGSITVPAGSIKSLSENGDDLYFRIVPIKKETEKNAAVNNAITAKIVTETAKGKEILVYSAPMVIETNYKNLPTTLKLSLKDISIPKDANEKKELVDKLAVFIKHSDGEEEVDRGTVIYNSQGNPTDIQIELTKFSTFTIIGFDNVAPVISNLKLKGTAKVGKTIKASYNYSDFDKDKEGNSLIKWYRADTAKGKNKKVISGADKLTYKVTKNDQGKYLIFSITPKSVSGSQTSKTTSGYVYVKESTLPKDTKDSSQKGDTGSKTVTYEAVLKLGLIGSKTYAEKIADLIEKNYGGANVKVIREDEYYRVTADYATKAKAKTGAENMKNGGYIINYTIN